MSNWGTQREALDGLVQEFKGWIETFLSIPESDWMFYQHMESRASNALFVGLQMHITEGAKVPYVSEIDRVATDISDVVFAPNTYWVFNLGEKQKGRTVLSTGLYTGGGDEGGDIASVVGFTVAGIRVVFLGRNYQSTQGAMSARTLHYIVTSRADSPKLWEYLKDVLNSISVVTYTIVTYDVNKSDEPIITHSAGLPQTWDNLVLDESILRLVKDDITSFFLRREWFLKNHIPFRRGYLFHGPPGNGKTSVVKTMLASLGMNAYRIRLFSSNVSDITLETMFRDAQEQGPNMVILEDLDRAFPKTGETKSHLGLHTLLNCLDGLESQEGVITVATANEPTALDKAILKRPGRFDRVILFDNPNHALRLGFFQKKAPYLTVKELNPVVDTTEGFSFAQLQETYIMAGQRAFERNSEDIVASDLCVYASELRGTANCVNTSRADKVGYV